MVKPRSLNRNFIALALILLLFGIEVAASLGDSQTVDEGAHLASGYSYWLTASYKLNLEHPPLVKLLSGAMLLPLGLNLPIEHSSWAEANQWDFSRQLIYHNTQPFKTLMFLGRLPVIGLVAALAALIFVWTKGLFGATAALFSLSLAVIDPTFLAHGRLITTDVPLALFFALTIFTWLRYLENPASKRRLLFFILAFTAAQLTKFSAIILWLIVILTYLIAWWRSTAWSNQVNNPNARYSLSKLIKTLALLLTGSLLLTWASYGFSIKKATGLQPVVAYYRSQQIQVEAGQPPNASPIPLVGNLLRIDRWPGRFIQTLSGALPIPAIEYFQGAVLVAQHNYYGHDAYLLGQAGNRGWWYYFPVAFFVKTPGTVIVMWGLTLISGSLIFIRRLKKSPHNFAARLKSLPLWSFGISLPPAVYFIFSIFSHINLGVRHLLPVYPFVYIGIGLLVQRYWNKRGLRICLLSLLSIGWISAIFTYPNHLAYFSEFVGGARNGPKYLLDSNLDWGQGYYALQQYVYLNPSQTYYGAFFGSLDWSSLELPPFKSLPTDQEIARSGPPNGTILVSASVLFDPNMDFKWLQQYQPAKILRGSIYVYNL